MHTTRLLVISLGAAALGSLAALKFLPASFVWIGLCGAAAGLALAARARPIAVRLAGLLGAALSLGLAATEVVLAIAGIPGDKPGVDYSARPFINDSVLGWRLVPDQVTRAVSRLGDSVLYDVRYTADSLGHRVAFPDSGRGGATCVAFVICSFTFGEGVQDWETLPYRVGAHSGGRIRTINLGVPGWGAEHMLATVERGIAPASVPCTPTHVVYQALPHHVLRAAGLVEYSRHGPRYRLAATGEPAYTGTTPPLDPALAQRGLGFELDWQLRKSRLYRFLRQPADARGSLEDLRLYLGIVRRARVLFRERYPQAEFHVLAWSLHDYFAGGFSGFRDSLALIAPTHAVADILPDYTTNPLRYEMDPWNAHPNPLAYDLLARFVVDSIARER